MGLGRLGASTAKIMQAAFGMRVVAWSPNLTQEARLTRRRARAGFPVETGGEKTFKAVSREELFRTADVLNIHVVLSERSRGLITAQDLGLMKPSALFVNTSRGPIVDEKDCWTRSAAAPSAPPPWTCSTSSRLPADSPWRTTKWGRDGRSDVLLSPHMGYVEESTMHKWYEAQADASRPGTRAASCKGEWLSGAAAGLERPRRLEGNAQTCSHCAVRLSGQRVPAGIQGRRERLARCWP